jgi:hypothetical protein
MGSMVHVGAAVSSYLSVGENSVGLLSRLARGRLGMPTRQSGYPSAYLFCPSASSPIMMCDGYAAWIISVTISSHLCGSGSQ